MSKNIIWKIKYIWYPLSIAWILYNLVLPWLRPLGEKGEEWLEKHNKQ